MKEISESKLEQMKVPEVREFLHNINEAIETCPALETMIPEGCAMWHSAYDAMVNAYETPLKNDETDEIHTLDYIRDNWLTGAKALTNGYRKSPNADEAAAGEAVWTAFGSFPVQLNTNYIAESAQIDSLVSVLLTDLHDELEAINLLVIIQKIKDTNDRIHMLVQERDEVNSERKDGFRPQARQAAIDAYLQFVKYVNGYRLVVAGSRPVPELDQFIELVNSIIARFYRVVLRETSKKPEEEKPEGDGETTEGVTPPSDKPEEMPDQTPSEEEKPNEGNGNTGTGSGSDNENTSGTPPEDEDPNMPPPGSGGSGFE